MSPLSGYGITLELRSGWYGEIFRDTDGVDDTGPIVHLANTPIIIGDHESYASQTRQIMRPNDAVVAIVNLPSLPNILTAGDAERVGPARGWSLQGADTAAFSGVPAGQSSLRKTIHVAERVFDLIAFFATPSPSRGLVTAIDSVLTTVRIDASQRPRGSRLDQYFSVAAAIRALEEVRRDVWARDAAHATSEELAEHGAAFPGNG